MEAGESVEEAVRREALEETGITVNRVVYHSSQPWVRNYNRTFEHFTDGLPCVSSHFQTP